MPIELNSEPLMEPPPVVPHRDSPVEVASTRSETFWKEAFALYGSITPHVLPNVFFMGAISVVICYLASLARQHLGIRAELAVAPYEFMGAALGLLLVLRTNSGYERWWEARKLWGAIVNQCRNLAISAVAYGPNNLVWRSEFLRWVAAFPHVARVSLRREKPDDESVRLLGVESVDRLSRADHMPNLVCAKLAFLLSDARKGDDAIDGFSFMQIDEQRALLIDHIGACERILKTPLPFAYSIKIRRFIAIFLITLPLALIHEVGNNWLVPTITMLVAYPLFSLDQLGVELQNPFDTRHLNHLPLDDISKNIARNVMALNEIDR